MVWNRNIPIFTLPFFCAIGIADKHLEHHHKQIDVLSVDFWVMFEMWFPDFTLRTSTRVKCRRNVFQMMFYVFRPIYFSFLMTCPYAFQVCMFARNRSLHDLAQFLMRKFCGNSGEILPGIGPSKKIREILLKTSHPCKRIGKNKTFRYPCMTCTGHSAKILFQSSLQDFALRSWGCSAWSRASPCQKILRKSWRSPFDEILSKRSLREDLANTMS